MWQAVEGGLDGSQIKSVSKAALLMQCKESKNWLARP